MLIFSFLFVILQQRSWRQWARALSAAKIPLAFRFLLIFFLSILFLLTVATIDVALQMVLELVLRGSALSFDFHFQLSDAMMPFDLKNSTSSAIVFFNALI